MRYADPSPGFCSRCMNSTTEPLVELIGSWEGQPIIDSDTGAIGFVGGRIAIHESCCICSSCVQELVDFLDAKPELRDRLARERDEAQREAVEWKSYARNLEDDFQRRPEPIKRGPGRPRKVPVDA